MVVDTCQACGEEHEPPRGAKCKLVKSKKPSLKGVKIETEVMAEEVESMAVTCPVGEATDTMCKLSLDPVKPTGDCELVAVEPDEEELELRRQLEQRVAGRRKAKLRAAIERDSSEEEVVTTKSRRKHKSKRKPRSKSRKAGRREKGKGGTKGGGGSSPSSPSSSSSSSSSSSTTSESESSGSRERRRRRRKNRSKFYIDKYIKGRKSVRKITFIELLHAALVWGAKRAKKVDMNMAAVRGYMGHLAYMCMHATTGNYSDEAYREYDRAVRDKVKDKGLRAFRMGDNALSLLHFNLDNARAMRENRKGRTTSSRRRTEGASSGSKVRGACYAHNYNKEGCTRKKCDWDHHCISCKSTEHVIENCPNKKY